MKGALLAWIVFECLGVSFVQSPSPQDFALANATTRRLPPSAFPNLPTKIRTELDRRRCSIPQTFIGGSRHNVIQGHFRNGDQVDWAILCSRDRVSTILVFWGGEPRAVTALAPKPDADFLQTVSRTEIGFSRAITVASKESILEHYKRHGGVKPPPLAHAGIEDAFVEKASVVWYRHQGMWLQLTGSD